MPSRRITLPTQLGATSHHDGILVRGGAQLLGAIADAVVHVDDREHRRRLAVGLSAVESVDVLDALMCLPLGEPVSTVDLDDTTRGDLTCAPLGALEWAEDTPTRLLTWACSVDLVVVRAVEWRSGLLRAAKFAPFARATVLLEGEAPEGAAWEADVAGVGLTEHRLDGVAQDLVVPAPFQRRYVKPVAWAFAERAYANWRHADLHQPGDSAARH